MNHLKLQHINELARRNNLPDVFKSVTHLPMDNGEIFLSDYFVEQKARNNKFHPTLKETLCKCLQCNNSTVIGDRMDIVAAAAASIKPKNNNSIVIKPRLPPLPPPPQILSIILIT